MMVWTHLAAAAGGFLLAVLFAFFLALWVAPRD